MILLKDPLWFETHQSLLLRMVNGSKEVRDILGIPTYLPEITYIDRGAYHYELFRSPIKVWKSGVFMSRQPIGDKIRARWSEFQKASKFFYDHGDRTQIIDPKTRELALACTTDTFYPAAGSNSPVDGRLPNVHASSWSTCHDASSGTDAVDDDAYIQVRSQKNGSEYRIIRGVFLFDTSSIGGSSTVDSAVLSLYNATAGDNGPADAYDIDIVASTPASNNTLVVGDYDQFGTTVFASIALSTIIGSDAYNDFTLDSNGEANITKDGISKFGARISGDVDNSAPTGLNNVGIYMADNGSNKPKLVPVWTIPLIPADWGRRASLTIDATKVAT